MIIKQLLSILGSAATTHKSHHDEQVYRDLIRKEAKIGGELFGPIAQGGRREFFCLNPRTWVWHEEWLDAQGEKRAITTRYDVRENGILKAQDNQPYQYLNKDEATRLHQAASMYMTRVNSELYQLASYTNFISK